MRRQMRTWMFSAFLCIATAGVAQGRNMSHCTFDIMDSAVQCDRQDNAQTSPRQNEMQEYLLLSATAAPPAPSAAVNRDMLASAINIAGRQRMLSQRIARAYVQIYLNVNAAEAQAILAESARNFDNQLVTLQLFTPNAEIRKAIENEVANWEQVKAIVSKPFDNAGMDRLVGLSEELLAAAQAATIAYESLARTPSARLIDVAGRQRMLSQRIAKLFLLERIGLGQPSEMQKAKKEFEAALNEMYSSQQTTPEIRAELDLAKVQWGFIDTAIAARPAADADQVLQIRHVATTSERILGVMDQVTQMYEKTLR